MSQSIYLYIISGSRWGPSGPAAQQRSHRWSTNSRTGNRNSRGDIQRRGSNGNSWTLVQHRRKPRGRHGSTSVPGLQGAPPPISRVFIYRVQQGNVQVINEYLHKNNIEVIENVKVSHDEAAFSSYKVTLSIYDRNKVLRDGFWRGAARGIQCKLWHDPKPDNNESEDENTEDDSELTGNTRVAES